MTPAQDISAEVDSIGATIRHARDALEAGGRIDVSPIEARVRALCVCLGQIRYTESTVFHARILALIDEFSQLGTSIESRLESLRGDIKRIGG